MAPRLSVPGGLSFGTTRRPWFGTVEGMPDFKHVIIFVLVMILIGSCNSRL